MNISYYQLISTQTSHLASHSLQVVTCLCRRPVSDAFIFKNYIKSNVELDGHITRKRFYYHLIYISFLPVFRKIGNWFLEIKQRVLLEFISLINCVQSSGDNKKYVNSRKIWIFKLDTFFVISKGNL